MPVLCQLVAVDAVKHIIKVRRVHFELIELCPVDAVKYQLGAPTLQPHQVGPSVHIQQASMVVILRLGRFVLACPLYLHRSLEQRFRFGLFALAREDITKITETDRGLILLVLVRLMLGPHVPLKILFIFKSLAAEGTLHFALLKLLDLRVFVEIVVVDCLLKVVEGTRRS